MKLIINADDFGKDENATMAIAESYRRGFITQTTLMVNMPWAEKAVELVKREGLSEKIGLHITLSEGTPITKAIRKCSKFCDTDGGFKRDGFRANVWSPYDKEEQLALGEELEAQILRYLDFKLPLMHCDGHHHSHIWLPVYRVLAPLLEKYGFKSVRKSVDSPWEHLLHPRLRGWCMDTIRHFLHPRNIKLADHFGSVELYNRRKLYFRRDSIVEVMVHPRYNSEGRLVDYKSTNGRPMREVFDELVSPDVSLCTYSGGAV